MWFGCYDVSPWSWVYSRELPTSTPNLQGEIKLLTNPGAESNFPWQWRRWTWEAYRWDFFFFNNLLNSNINYSILKLRPISRTYAQIPYFCFPSVTTPAHPLHPEPSYRAASADRRSASGARGRFDARSPNASRSGLHRSSSLRGLRPAEVDAVNTHRLRTGII